MYNTLICYSLFITCVFDIVGETLFNASYPSEPPDFIFIGSDQQFHPHIADLKVLNFGYHKVVNIINYCFIEHSAAHRPPVC